MGERPKTDPPPEPSAGAWPHQHLNFILFPSVRLAAPGLRRSMWALHRGAQASLVVAPGLSRPEACGILVPQPGITPASPALEGGLLTTGPSRKFLKYSLKMNVLVAQSGPALFDPMDCSPPASSVRGIFQARILEQVAVPFSKGSS